MPIPTRRIPPPDLPIERMERSTWLRRSTSRWDMFWGVGWMLLFIFRAPAWFIGCWMVCAVVHAFALQLRRPARQHLRRLEKAHDDAAAALERWARAQGLTPRQHEPGWSGAIHGLGVDVGFAVGVDAPVPSRAEATATPTSPDPALAGTRGGWGVSIHLPALRDVEAAVSRPEPGADWSRAVIVGPRAWRQRYACVGRLEWATLLLVLPARAHVDALLERGGEVGRGRVRFDALALAAAPDEVALRLEQALQACLALDAALQPPRRAEALWTTASNPDEPPQLRRNALGALCTLWPADPLTHERVHRLTTDPNPMVATEALGRYAGVDDAPLLAAAADNSRPDRFRATALWRLAERGGGGAAGEALAAQAWASGGRLARAAALQVAGSTAAPWFGEALFTAVSTRHLLVAHGRWALPTPRDADAAWPPAFPGTADGTGLDWRHELEGAAEVIPFEALAAPAREWRPGSGAPAREATDEVRWIAHAGALALTRYGDDSCVDAAVEALHSPAARVRAAGVDFLRQRAAPQAFAGMARALAEAPLTDDQRATLRRVMYAIEQRGAHVAGAISVIAPSLEGALSTPSRAIGTIGHGEED